jgi:hypothetical protein
MLEENVVNANMRSQIAERAYFIWKENGCPDGKAMENWLQAEAELSTRTTKELSLPATIKRQAKRSRSEKRY